MHTEHFFTQGKAFPAGEAWKVNGWMDRNCQSWSTPKIKERSGEAHKITNLLVVSGSFWSEFYSVTWGNDFWSFNDQSNNLTCLGKNKWMNKIKLKVRSWKEKQKHSVCDFGLPPTGVVNQYGGRNSLGTIAVEYRHETSHTFNEKHYKDRQNKW